MTSRIAKQLHFLHHFSALPDPRIAGMVLYPLDEMLLCALCACLADNNDYEEIAFWGEENLAFLRQFLPYAHGIPSERTFRDVFARLDAKAFQRCFAQWMSAMLGTVNGVIAVDGKTLRGSKTYAGDHACHVVSAFAHAHGMVLTQCAVKEKSNEITAIPELLAAMELEGCIVTLDAMGTQRAIAAQIIAQKGDYILALKGNQGTLHGDVKLFFEQTPPEFALATQEENDKGHGRVETRKCSVSADIGWLQEPHNWPGLRSIVRIESERTMQGKTSKETRYYISSLPADAVRILASVRAHWSVESMHWTLDVIFKDDLSTARKDHSALNLTTIKRAAHNLLKANQDPIPLKRKRKKAAWNHDFLKKLLESKN